MTGKPRRPFLPLRKIMVVLDRDGTLIEERGYLGDPKGVQLMPGVVAGLKRLRKAGARVVVVSNQSGIARGLITERDVRAVNRRMIELLRRKRVRIDGLYWCPHGPGEGCKCRKPGVALLREASRRLGVPWRGCVVVGDHRSDVALGHQAQGAGVLLLTGHGREEAGRRIGPRPDHVAKNFTEAVRWILTKWEGRKI